MRSVLREYNYDWRLWSIVHNASKICDGSDKEYREAIAFAPNFKETMDTLISMGEPGVLTLKAVADILKDILTARERGKKVALVTYNLSPAILHAFDVVPICLEGLSGLFAIVWQKGIAECLDYCCEVGFTETSCSGQRVALGPLLAGVGVQPDFILCSTPGLCDSNANSFSFASAYLDLPFCQLNYPPTLTDERSSEYHREDFRQLIAFLEEQTRKKLDPDRLKDICEEMIKQDELVNELQELQRLVPNPEPGLYNLLIYASKILFIGAKEGTEILESMLKIAKENAVKGIVGNNSGQERARGAFFYVDHFSIELKWWTWLSRNGISHVGTMVDDFWQAEAPYAKGREEEGYVIDTTNMDTMIDSLAAQTSRTPMVKQLRGPYDAPHMWLDDTIGLAKTMNADFLVYLGTMGCRNSWGIVKLLARDTEKLGWPTLILYGDAFDNRVESIDSLIGKVDEFLTVRRICK
ncbi:MAG: 2-hydroxyacyl-CoA dehydratase family protein [Thermodesulfobacteriota bacterium]|nr:2-hydroxyacyl-CoA dehydratase family protein [Thermodesulfobacteriota bacterium]